MPNINLNSGKQMGEAVKNTASAGLIVQTACVSIQRQPLLYLPKELQAKMPDVNGYIRTAQGNATRYLNSVQPQIITVITDVSGFSVIFPRLAKDINGYLKAWSVGSMDNKKRALDAIAALKKVVHEKGDAVNGVVVDIGDMMGLFNGDVAHFQEVSQACEAQLTGDKGELRELEKQLSSIDGKIAGASVGVGVSGLAIIGGAFMILVGSIASFVTAGTSTPLVVAGAVIAGTGTAGLVASSVILAELIKTKGELLTRKALLDNYVNALTGCQSNIDQLNANAQEASNKLSLMKDAWGFLGGDLGQVEGMLADAQSYSDLPSIVQAFFESAEGQWASVNADIELIKKQMAGVEEKELPKQQPRLRSAASGADVALGEISEESVRRMVS